MAPPPELADDLLVEAFLRLSPDDLACLLRASLTCKRWRRVLADPAFRRRHRELTARPPSSARPPPVLEFQLGTRRLFVIDGPRLRGGDPGSFISLVSMEDGGLCCTDVELRPSQRLCLWSKEAGTDGIAHWERGRCFELEKLLPNGALPDPGSPFPAWLTKSLVLGFAEGTDVIFVGTETHIFDNGAAYMIQLNSGKARKVFEGRSMVFPYTSFCIPVIDAACADKGAGVGVSSA